MSANPPAPLEPLEAKRILNALSHPGRAALTRLDLHAQLDSTNTELMRQAAAGAPSATACLAECQTAGRGRRGRLWVSPRGANLYLSMLWRYPLPPAALGGTSLVVGAVVAEVLQALGAQHLSLKWPNDLLWRGQKLAGLLLEVGGAAQGPSYLVVGIGLNLHMTPAEGSQIDQPWTALQQVLAGQAFSRNLVAARLLDALLIALERYGHDGLVPFLDRWRHFEHWQGQPVQLRFGEQCISGIYAGIADDGSLRLETGGGFQYFQAGEVSLRRMAEVASALGNERLAFRAAEVFDTQ